MFKQAEGWPHGCLINPQELYIHVLSPPVKPLSLMGVQAKWKDRTITSQFAFRSLSFVLLNAHIMPSIFNTRECNWQCINTEGIFAQQPQTNVSVKIIF